MYVYLTNPISGAVIREYRFAYYSQLMAFIHYVADVGLYGYTVHFPASEFIAA